MLNNIAFFDFDGTITRKDTMLELIKYSKGKSNYYIGLLFLSPWLIAMKMGLISNKKGKEKMLSYFFKGFEEKEFTEICNTFSATVIHSLIRKDAMEAIKTHLANNVTIVIVSASAENWVAPWCRKNNLQFICTRLLVKENKITGKLDGENCNGHEKVSRIKELFNLADYSIIYCYGDTKGDKMMLQLATYPFYKPFEN